MTVKIMENRTLGKSGLNISPIGLGTVQFGVDYGFTKRKTQDEADEILSAAEKHGVNFLDTAPAYGDSEEKIGRYVSGRKNPFVIASKIEKITTDDVNNKDDIKQKIVSSVEKSLNRLGLSQLDALQLHQADSYIISNSFFWSTIEYLKEQKIIKSFGISLYETNEAELILKEYGHVVDFLQIPYNVFDRRFEKYKDTILDKNTGVIARSVFLKGVITCDSESVPAELSGIKPYKEALGRISSKTGLKPYETALLFVLKKRFIHTVILGINSVKELEENIRIQKKMDDIKDFINEIEQLTVMDHFLIDPRLWKSI